MGEFVFIIPQGWTQIPSQSLAELGSVVGDWINIGDLTSLSDALKARGDIGPDAILVEARLFNGEVLAIRLG